MHFGKIIKPSISVVTILPQVPPTTARAGHHRKSNSSSELKIFHRNYADNIIAHLIAEVYPGPGITA